MEFKREERYIVFKLSEVEEHFTSSEKEQLARLVEIERVGREESVKKPLECVVVEKDWPEYEPTWKAIEARVTGAHAQPAPNDEYVGWYCAHCQRGVDASEVTYHEQHEVCGRVITNDRPQKPEAQPAPSVPNLSDPTVQKRLMSQRGYRYQRCTYPSCESTVGCLGVCHQEVKP